MGEGLPWYIIYTEDLCSQSTGVIPHADGIGVRLNKLFTPSFSPLLISDVFEMTDYFHLWLVTFVSADVKDVEGS